MGSAFGFIASNSNITIKKITESCFSTTHCMSAYEFTDAQIGSTVTFEVSAGAGFVILSLD